MPGVILAGNVLLEAGNPATAGGTGQAEPANILFF
jgi:hypothetical protein